MYDDDHPLLLDAKQAATMLSLSERHVRQMARDGRLPFVRIGPLMRFCLDDLEEWAKQHKASVRRPDRQSPTDLKTAVAMMWQALKFVEREVAGDVEGVMTIAGLKGQVDRLAGEVRRLEADRKADADVMAQKDKLILDLKDQIAMLGAKLSSAEEEINNLHAQLQRQEEEHFAQVGKLKAQRMASEGRQTAQERRRGLSKPMAGEGGDAPYRGVADNAK